MFLALLNGVWSVELSLSAQQSHTAAWFQQNRWIMNDAQRVQRFARCPSVVTTLSMCFTFKELKLTFSKVPTYDLLYHSALLLERLTFSKLPLCGDALSMCLKAVFHCRVFHTHVHARKTLNPFRCYLWNNQINKSTKFSVPYVLVCIC